MEVVLVAMALTQPTAVEAGVAVAAQEVILVKEETLTITEGRDIRLVLAEAVVLDLLLVAAWGFLGKVLTALLASMAAAAALAEEAVHPMRLIAPHPLMVALTVVVEAVWTILWAA
jgi:hypothetical protein